MLKGWGVRGGRRDGGRRDGRGFGGSRRLSCGRRQVLRRVVVPFCRLSVLDGWIGGGEIWFDR